MTSEGAARDSARNLSKTDGANKRDSGRLYNGGSGRLPGEVHASRVVPDFNVITAAAKFDQVPDFQAKADLKADLEGRAQRQQHAFNVRDVSNTQGEVLEGLLDQAVEQANEALFVIEKHLEARFPRDVKYVASFFMEKPSRKKKKTPDAPKAPDAP